MIPCRTAAHAAHTYQGCNRQRVLNSMPLRSLRRVTKFNGVHSIDLHFPEAFHGDQTEIHFIGFKGEFSEVGRGRVGGPAGWQQLGMQLPWGGWSEPRGAARLAGPPLVACCGRPCPPPLPALPCPVTCRMPHRQLMVSWVQRVPSAVHLCGGGSLLSPPLAGLAAAKASSRGGVRAQASPERPQSARVRARGTLWHVIMYQDPGSPAGCPPPPPTHPRAPVTRFAAMGPVTRRSQCCKKPQQGAGRRARALGKGARACRACCRPHDHLWLRDPSAQLAAVPPAGLLGQAPAQPACLPPIRPR